MTRPLELTVYPKWEPCHSGNECQAKRWNCVQCFTDMGHRKAFTDAELAAEYNGKLAHFNRMCFNEQIVGEPYPEDTWERLSNRLADIHRFATLPHYDEAAS